MAGPAQGGHIMLAQFGRCVFVCSVVGSASPALASQILITHDKAVAGNVTPGDAIGYPVTLSRAGSYKLDSNLSPGAGKDGIVAASSDIAIDLNGFTISGGAAGGTNNGRFGIYDLGDRLTVRNGTIGAFTSVGPSAASAGIYAPNRAYLIVENMRIINSGIGIDSGGGSFTRIQDSTVSTNRGRGILCSTACQVQDSLVSSNGSDGIWCARGCLIEGNVVSYNLKSGIYIYDSGVVLGNTLIVRRQSF
jgi:parallel beta-helix repeat protein